MSDLLSIIKSDGLVEEFVQLHYGKAGLFALGLGDSPEAVTQPKASTKATKASKAAKATKSTKAPATRNKPQDVNVKVGDKFVHNGRDGELSLVVAKEGEDFIYVTQDGAKHPSLTAAAKHVTGQASINGRKFWTAA